ncbi:hypothetical protein CapIbe_024130, partial [Capra ibex]
AIRRVQIRQFGSRTD